MPDRADAPEADALPSPAASFADAALHLQDQIRPLALDQIAPLRFGGVRAEGARHTELTFGRRSCDAEFLARVAPRDTEPALGALGFTTLRCANGRDARTLTRE